MKLLRHLLGYTVGFSIFAVLIPVSIYYFSSRVDALLGLVRFGNSLLRLITAIPVLSFGVFFVLWSNLFLLIRGKGGPADGFGVALSPRTEQLVISGPYRYTRNPMVFGALTSYVALALFLGYYSGVALLAVFIPVVILYLKWVEEPRLLTDFGDEYVKYRGSVSMLLPLPSKEEHCIHSA